MTEPAASTALVDQHVSVVARQMLTRRDAFIAALFEITRVEVQVLDEDSRMRALLEASITENIVSAVNFLDNGTPVEELEAPTAALTYARTLAQRDVPLSALIRAYRIGHSQFLDVALALIDAVPSPEQMEVVLQFVRRSAEYIDKVCDQVGRSYEVERDRWVSSRSGLRQQAVNEVLAGGRVDIEQVEKTLRYPFDGVHVAVQAWPQPTVSDFDVVKLFADTRTVVGTVLAALGPPLLVPNDEREARMWFTVRAGSVVSAPDLVGAVTAAGLPVHLAVGSAERGLDGFRRTVRQAGRVRGIKLAAGSTSPQVVTYDEVATLALMADDLPELTRFVSTQLRGLAADDERSAMLRETLRVFLGRNRSFAATATAMLLHRNTIQYRVQQALDVCGRDLDEPGAAFEVEAALNAAHWLGPSVLGPGA